MSLNRLAAVRRRHNRIRKKVRGTAERPRLCMHKSLRHLYVQLVDDDANKTLAFATTNRKENKDGGKVKSFRNIEWAKRLGAEIADKAIKAGMKTVVFDRGGYQYHGCVKEFAEAARKTGLKF